MPLTKYRRRLSVLNRAGLSFITQGNQLIRKTNTETTPMPFVLGSGKTGESRLYLAARLSPLPIELSVSGWELAVL